MTVKTLNIDVTKPVDGVQPDKSEHRTMRSEVKTKYETLAVQALRYRGAWASGTFLSGDVVQYNGMWFYASANLTTEEPGVHASWTPLFAVYKTTADWALSTYVLPLNVLGITSDGKVVKRGNGTDTFGNLSNVNPTDADVPSDPDVTGIVGATTVSAALTSLKTTTNDIIASGGGGSNTGLPRTLTADGSGAGNVYALEDSNREIVDVSSALRQTTIWAYHASNPVIFEVDSAATDGATWAIGVRDDMTGAVTLRPKPVEVAVTGDFTNTSDTVEITSGYSSLRVGQTLSSFPGAENLIANGSSIIALLTSPDRAQFSAAANGTDTAVDFVMADAGLINQQVPPLTLASGESYYVSKAVSTIAGVTVVAAGNFQGGTSVVRNNLQGEPDASTDERRRIGGFSLLSEHVEIATPTTADKEHAGVTIWSDGDDVTINAGVFEAEEWIGLKFIGTTAPAFVAGTNVTFSKPTGYDPEPAAAGRRIVARNTGELSGSDEIWEVDGFMAETP